MNYTSKSLNKKILSFARSGGNTNEISDTYHTFGELYEHRVMLFALTLTILTNVGKDEGLTPLTWKSKKHSDGTSWDGWFIAGIGFEKGRQITYHIPIDKWDLFKVQSLEKAPEFDGHTAEDVLERLKTLIKL